MERKRKFVEIKKNRKYFQVKLLTENEDVCEWCFDVWWFASGQKFISGKGDRLWTGYVHWGMFVFNQTIELLWILTLNIFIIYSWWVCFLSLFFNHTLYTNTSMKGMKPLVPALHHIVSNLDKMPCHWHAKKLDQGKRSRMCIWVNHSSINILCVQAIYFK